MPLSFLTTDESDISAEVLRRRRWVLILILLFLCLVGAFTARPAYRWGRAWRARSLAAQAEKLIEEQKWPQAAGKAQAAHQLAPGEPAVLRAFARLYSRAGVPSAFEFWTKFLPLPEATVQDRREAIRAALQFNRLDFAEEQIGVLLKAAPVEAETLELAGQLSLQKGDRAAALEFVNRLIAQNPAHPSAPLLGARLLFTSPDPAQQAEGKRQLQQLAKGDTLSSLNALRLIAGARSLSADELQSLEAALAGHPQATTDDQLTAVTLRIRAAPEQRGVLIDQAIQRFASAGPDALVALGRWVNQQREYARVIEFISLPASLTREDLFLVRLDALAALARWSEIQRILKDEKTPLEDVHREIFLARAAQELEEPRGAEARWGNALRSAGEKPQALLFVAQYAERVGVRDVAEEAYRKLARQPIWALRANTALVPFLEAKGDTRGLRDVIKHLVRLSPTDPTPRNDAAYLDLLLEEDLSAAKQTAEQLVRERPERLAYRTTLALAHLRSGDSAAAARLYEGLQVPWDQTPPGWQAIRAAVLAANGQSEEARTLIAALPLDRLKPEERALVEPLK